MRTAILVSGFHKQKAATLRWERLRYKRSPRNLDFNTLELPVASNLFSNRLNEDCPAPLSCSFRSSDRSAGQPSGDGRHCNPHILPQSDRLTGAKVGARNDPYLDENGDIAWLGQSRIGLAEGPLSASSRRQQLSECHVETRSTSI